MGTSMIDNRMCALALSAASALICFAPPASAAKFDGNWSMTAVTTRGHCGTIPIGMGVAGGRIYSTGGSFAFYSISLGGRVSNSGSVSLKAVAGPRVAHGTGRFTRRARQRHVEGARTVGSVLGRVERHARLTLATCTRPGARPRCRNVFEIVALQRGWDGRSIRAVERAAISLRRVACRRRAKSALCRWSIHLRERSS